MSVVQEVQEVYLLRLTYCTCFFLFVASLFFVAAFLIFYLEMKLFTAVLFKVQSTVLFSSVLEIKEFNHSILEILLAITLVLRLI